MTTLSVELPDLLVEKSQTLAQQQGISYADFILIQHPLNQPFANKWVGKFKLEESHFEEARFEYLKEKYHL